MPLYLQHKEETCSWGIWRIDETEEALLSLLPHAEDYARVMAGKYTSPHRRLEWLAVRVLLFTLLGEEKEIAYLPSGKPYLTDGSYALGISHTKGYAAVIWGRADSEVGIDIEQAGERVRKVARRFMRPDEVAAPFEGDDVWSMLLHWSAKETLFKCLNESEIDFKEHLRIFPFSPQRQGCFKACEYKTDRRQLFRVAYRITPDFVLTWTSFPKDGNLTGEH